MSTNPLVTKLNQMFAQDKRYNNFGNILVSMSAHGFRGVSGTMQFDFPITVIVGKNGSGKSTLAQLALCCYRYRKNERCPYNPKEYYSLGHFFLKSQLDPTPYAEDASVEYTYAISEDERGKVHQLSLFEDNEQILCKTTSLHRVNQDWGGYKSRPIRRCIYFGMGFFVPHHDTGDRIYLDTKTKIDKRKKISSVEHKKIMQILGYPYSNIEVDTITNQSKTAEMGFASIGPITYSENHMGCGEARLIRMVHAFETAPEKSLIVIEEPETALHQDAQYQFAQYLLDICCRKKHQIIITTHSPTIANALPISSRKMIERTSDGQTRLENNPAVAEIIAEMSGGHNKSILIYVEDDFSKKLLTEILRKYYPVFRSSVSIADVGNKDDVRNAVLFTEKHKQINTFGVRDEAHTAAIKENIFAYPDDQAPEITVFTNAQVKAFVKKQYDVDFSAKIIEDHHNYGEFISRKAGVSKDVIDVQCIQVFLDTDDAIKYQTFAAQIYEYAIRNEKKSIF